jgi:hypothetical protein
MESMEDLLIVVLIDDWCKTEVYHKTCLCSVDFSLRLF